MSSDYCNKQPSSTIWQEISRHYESYIEFHKVEQDGIFDWHSILDQKGYTAIQLPPELINSFEVNQWCCDNIGRELFARVGNTMWFDNEMLAEMFVLKWIQ